MLVAAIAAAGVHLHDAVMPAPPPPSLMLFDIDAAPPASPPVPVQPHVARQVTPQHQASVPVPPPVPAPLQAPVPIVRSLPASAAASAPTPPAPALPHPAPPPAAPPTPDAPPAVAPAGASETSWEGQVLARLAKRKAYPEAARSAGIEGTALVRFTVTRNGGLLGVALVASSGSALLDHAATAAVAHAVPFPPIPPTRAERIELTVPVSFSLSALRER